MRKIWGALLKHWRNERVLVGAEKQLYDFRAAATLVIQSLMPTPVREEAVSEVAERILEQLRAAPDVTRVVERSSVWECVTMRALSILHLHYPRVVMGRITMGFPRGSTEVDERAAEKHVAPMVDGIVADLDLGDQ